ncbi:MAG: hypothetical protein AVDCRST_MAG89-3918, partial [uncultured Gemmatimonadetes bacterium]
GICLRSRTRCEPATEADYGTARIHRCEGSGLEGLGRSALAGLYGVAGKGRAPGAPDSRLHAGAPAEPRAAPADRGARAGARLGVLRVRRRKAPPDSAPAQLGRGIGSGAGGPVRPGQSRTRPAL